MAVCPFLPLLLSLNYLTLAKRAPSFPWATNSYLSLNTQCGLGGLRPLLNSKSSPEGLYTIHRLCDTGHSGQSQNGQVTRFRTRSQNACQRASPARSHMKVHAPHGWRGDMQLRRTCGSSVTTVQSPVD